MKKSNHASLRQILRDNPEGLTAERLAEMIGRSGATTRRSLESMPDAYIDRWQGPNRGQYAAVWCVVVPPVHCPHPRDQVKPRTQWVGFNVPWVN